MSHLKITTALLTRTLGTLSEEDNFLGTEVNDTHMEELVLH